MTGAADNSFTEEKKRDEPTTTATNQSSTATNVVTQWLQQFQQALNDLDIDRVVHMFETNGFWRDLLTLTWNLYTAEGQQEIRSMLENTLKHTLPISIQVNTDITNAVQQQDDGVITAFLKVETRVGRGNGFIRLRRSSENGQGVLCWTLMTSLTELKGYEEKRGLNRPLGTVHEVKPEHQLNWLETKQQEEAELGYSRQPYVLIVGGGQGGIALGARLKQLNVPTIIVDRHARPGNQWRKRYKSLCLHDPVWYDHLPYVNFPDNWPIFSPKDKIGDWLESYAKVMELNYWPSTECVKAKWDQQGNAWTVQVNRNGQPVTLRPKQLVFATGMSGVASMPTFKGMETFQGIQHHSSQHPGGDQFKGKRVVVVGSNNSSHDICGDLYQNGADVTMLQRTSTHIARSSSLMEYALGSLYSEQAVANGITVDKADLINASIPYRIMPQFHIPAYNTIKKVDADFYARLEKAGFMLDWGADGSGLFMKYLRRGSGYYIDVGASDLVADGKIKLKSNVEIEEIRERSIMLSDGTELPADVIVYATGYTSMNKWLEPLISKEVAEKVGKVWGLGSDTTKDPGPWMGELRNMWKPTKQEALWMHGGNLAQSRYYSQHLALQLKARMENIPTPVYGQAEVYHKA